MADERAAGRGRDGRGASRRVVALAVAACLTAGCAQISREPPPTASDRSLAAEEIRRLSLRADELYGQQPRRLPLVLEAYTLYQRCAEAGAQDYELAWRGARAGVWAAQRVEDRARQKTFAESALRLANAAVVADPARPEGHYYHALAAGMLASADHDYGLDAMKVMIEDGTRLVGIDEKWNYAAAHRLLGNFYHKSPGPPIGKGSDRKARQHLERAVEFAPEYPGNWIYLVELDVDEEDIERGREHLAKFHGLSVLPGLAAEHAEWRKEAARLATELNRLEQD